MIQVQDNSKNAEMDQNGLEDNNSDDFEQLDLTLNPLQIITPGLEDYESLKSVQSALYDQKKKNPGIKKMIDCLNPNQEWILLSFGEVTTFKFEDKCFHRVVSFTY